MINDETPELERLRREVVALTTKLGEANRSRGSMGAQLERLRTENRALRVARDLGPHGVTLAGDEIGRKTT